MGMLASGFVIANAAQPSPADAGTVKPIASNQPAYALKWTPSTAYLRGQQVISPNDDVTTAIVSHTSSATFATDAQKWALSSTFARPPRASSSIQYVTPNGTAGASGTSWGTAKNSFEEAIASFGGYGQGVVYGVGTFVRSTPLRIPGRVRLVGGAGFTGSDAPGEGALVFKAAPGATLDSVLLCGQADGDMWHFGGVENLMVDGNHSNGASCSGIRVDGFGENAYLRRIMVNDCAGSGFLMTGQHAVGHVEDCTANSNLAGGFRFTKNTTGSFRILGNSGTCRMVGISGDANVPALLWADGAQSLDVMGMKHEYKVNSTDNAVLWEGDWDGGGRGRLMLTGSSDPLAGAGSVGGDCVKIAGTAHPAITLAGFGAHNWTNLINDTVAGLVVPNQGGANPGFVYWCTDGDDSAVMHSQGGFVTHNLRALTGGITLGNGNRNTIDGQLCAYNAAGTDLAPIFERKNDNIHIGDINGVMSGGGLILSGGWSYSQKIEGTRYSWANFGSGCFGVDVPFKLKDYTTATRPAASKGIGVCVYDSTLGKPIWSDGTVWKDATGTTV